MMELTSCKKRNQSFPLPNPMSAPVNTKERPCENTGRKPPSTARKRGLPKNGICGCLDLGPPAPGTGRNKCERHSVFGALGSSLNRPRHEGEEGVGGRERGARLGGYSKGQ